MTKEDITAKSDRILHHHGDLLIKVFSLLVALALFGLYFLTTSSTPSDTTVRDTQQVNQ